MWLRQTSRPSRIYITKRVWRHDKAMFLSDKPLGNALRRLTDIYPPIFSLFLLLAFRFSIFFFYSLFGPLKFIPLWKGVRKEVEKQPDLSHRPDLWDQRRLILTFCLSDITLGLLQKFRYEFSRSSCLRSCKNVRIIFVYTRNFVESLLTILYEILPEASDFHSLAMNHYLACPHPCIPYAHTLSEGYRVINYKACFDANLGQLY